LIAALGNLAETFLWSLLGGMPSDWVIQKDTKLLAASQRERLPAKIQARLGLTIPQVFGMDPKEWFPISRQIYSDVERNGKRDRLDAFNGNYGLNRGLAAGCFALACIALVEGNWAAALSLLAFCVIYIYRAYRFGMHYGRELYVQFLSMPDTPGKAPKEKKERQARAR
jgi:hypothetical protein